MPNRNKIIEHHYFDKFRRLVGLPSVVFDHGISPEPDIIFRAEGRKIGVEITWCYVTDGKRKVGEPHQRNARRRIIDQARKLFLEKGGRNIEASFNFGLIKRKKKQKSDLAHEIAEFVLKHQNISSGDTLHYAREQIPEIETIYLTSTEYPDPVWRNTQVHAARLLDTRTLETIIQRKEKKLHKNCDSYWLLIVIDAIDAAQNYVVRDVRPYNKPSKFEKIFLYEVLYEKVFVLLDAPSKGGLTRLEQPSLPE